MKQKYTLNIAGIQLSVVTEAPAEEVERICGLLDRKMREIALKSRCPKTEAALLCAMEFAADRNGLQDQVTELDKRCDQYELALEDLKGRLTDQAADLEKLRNENAVLRSLVTSGGSVAPDPIPPSAFFAEVAGAQTAAAPTPAKASRPTDTDGDEAPAEAPAESKRAKRSGSRVGLMFEQLSFDDAD